MSFLVLFPRCIFYDYNANRVQSADSKLAENGIRDTSYCNYMLYVIDLLLMMKVMEISLRISK